MKLVSSLKMAANRGRNVWEHKKLCFVQLVGNKFVYIRQFHGRYVLKNGVVFEL